jgi:ATP-dependent DNA ligase
MQLPVMPPVRPMLAKAVHEVPRAPGLRYEPKWDGFRCIVFRDGDEVELGSRNDKPLTRYFPELVEPCCGGPFRSGASSTARSSW